MEITERFTYKGKPIEDLSHGECLRALLVLCRELKALRETRSQDATTSLFESIFGKL